MSEFHRLRDQKYSEAEYLFQTIEMAKSDEEFSVDLCSTPPSQTDLEADFMYNIDSSSYPWKLIKRRKPRRRYTVSHGGGGGGTGSGSGSGGASANGHAILNICANGGGCSSLGGSGGLPPAPPSTPTSLTPTNTSLSSSLPNSGVGGLVTDEEQQRLDSLLYILDYAPKYKKKLKEQQRTDAELAELFNVVSITSSSSSTSKTKVQPERGIAAASRIIRKHDQGTTKIFKIHRHLRDSLQEYDEEDSVSAPEYDTEEEDTRFHRLGRVKSHRLLLTKRKKRFARFEQAERMEAMVDIFDEAMSFNET